MDETLRRTDSNTPPNGPVRLDLRQAAVDDQIAFWQDVAPTYRVRRANQRVLDVSATLWPLPDLMATRFASRGHRITRNVDRRSAKPVVKLRLYLRGGGRIQHGGGHKAFGPNSVVLIDQARNWTADYADHDQCSIFIPHERIGYRPSDYPAVSTFSQNTPSGALLRWSMEDFLARFSTGERDTTEVAAHRLCDLLEAVLKGGAVTSHAPDISAIRIDAMRRFVASRASGSIPKADEVARVFGVSRATVFRTFSADGGVRSFLMAQRLELARRALHASPAARGQIVRLAQDLHFASVSHFSDAFLDRYGERPSAYQTQRTGAATLASDAAAETYDLDTMLRQAKHAYSRMIG